ncbi:MAG: hypothetical protein KAJ18_08550 [Candidatus Omnitrophica bacterium]|nr:hypothetical protein [Candidatus Omnitrophota bacterium]
MVLKIDKMQSERLRKILKENLELAQKSPYNFCDRWCERCTHETQSYCQLYLDDLERRVTCIAHGREQDDPEVTEDIMRQQFEEIKEDLENFIEENDIDVEEIDPGDMEKIQNHADGIKEDPLHKTARQYSQKAKELLEKISDSNKKLSPRIFSDSQTVAWYHTLLPAKVYRGLCEFHEPVDEDDFTLNDAVAQFCICKKAIQQSTQALRNLKDSLSQDKNLIVELIALLHNIFSRIEAMERTI